MPLRFYRRFRAGPFRLNVGKRGISTSIGGRGAWLTLGRDRVRTTVGIPGTGLSWYEQRRLSPANANKPPLGDTLKRLLWVIVALFATGIVVMLMATLMR
jgi:hypothetical protein